MRQLQRVAEQVHLPMMPRPGNAVVDFLEEHDIGTKMLEGFDNPLWTIAPIDAANPLVDIVSDELKSHGSRSREKR